MEKTDYERMTTPEKVQYLYEKLNKVKPECFVEEPNQPLGDFWVCLKDAKKYDWEEYTYDDFLVSRWGFSDPNMVNRSCNVDGHIVGYPNDDGKPNYSKVSSWSFCCTQKTPDWFTQENIDNGRIWVKPIIVHKKKDSK